MVHVVPRGVGHGGVEPVDRGGRGEDQVRNTVVAAAFEHVAEAHEVGADVGRGVFEAVPHPGLGRQVDHMAETLGGEEPRHAVGVGQIEADEAEGVMFGQGREPRKARLFQAHVIIGVAVVKAHHRMSVGKEAPCEMVADEAGGAGNENVHAVSPE